MEISLTFQDSISLPTVELNTCAFDFLAFDNLLSLLF